MDLVAKIKNIVKGFYFNRNLIIQLAKNDFKNKYAESYLGIFWAFIQPTVTIMIFWFVFQVAFKSASIGETPYILWLVCGLIPWFFYSESVVTATTSLMEYSYLVKKVVFKVSILPFVKVISSLIIHLFFIIFIFYMFFLYGFMPSIYNIQVIYYSFCLLVFALSISFITAAITVFFKDFAQLINILLQLTMWLTPIMWSYKLIPFKYQSILKINPLFYIIEGYRDTFINHVWFYNRYNQTIYFWIVVLILFSLGIYIFRKLKPHFADVL